MFTEVRYFALAVILLCGCGDDSSAPADSSAPTDSSTPIDSSVATDSSARDADAASSDGGPRRDAGPPRPIGDAPAWATDMIAGRWYAVSGATPDLGLSPTNTAQALDPGPGPHRGSSGPRSVFAAWCGGAWAPGYGGKGAMVFWGGGHADYFGNEVYVWDAATRTFERLTDPSDSGDPWPGTTFADGVLPDGTPNPPHTYYFVDYRVATGEFVTARRQTLNSPSLSTGQISRFNFNTLTWANAFSPPPPGLFGSTTQNAGAAYDASRDGLWVVETDSLSWAFYDLSTDEWSLYREPSGAYRDGRGGVAYSPSLDAVFVAALATGDVSIVIALDPADPTAEKFILATDGVAVTYTGPASMQWSEALGGLVYVHENGSGAVHLLAAPVGDHRTETWTWSRLDDGGVALPAGRLYSKARIAAYDDVELLYYAQTWDTPVFAMRIDGLVPSP